jgi:guanylate kinase
MHAAVMLSGRMGAGKSTLLRTLFQDRPEFFRCVTLVTTRKPHKHDVAHPLNNSWSEYCYVTDSTLNFWLEGGHIATPVMDAENGYRYALLGSTFNNILSFDGCVIATAPPEHFETFRTLFSVYELNVLGLYLDVPPDVLHARLLRRGHDALEADTKIRHTMPWPDYAAEEGYSFISNPEDSEGVPRAALDQFYRAIGLAH